MNVEIWPSTVRWQVDDHRPIIAFEQTYVNFGIPNEKVELRMRKLYGTVL